MAQAVSHRPVTEEARVRGRVSPYKISDGQSGTGTRFYPSSWVSPVNIIHRGCPKSILRTLGDKQ
jgi:hypothetical protein